MDSNRSMNLSSRIREREAFANITRAARARSKFGRKRGKERRLTYGLISISVGRHETEG